jgi:diadenosine tetraphosphate (Ap4A) HIT family hydrolase
VPDFSSDYIVTDPTCPFCKKLASLSDLPADEVVWPFTHSVAILGPWQYYQGYCILVARTHATEMFQLSKDERSAYLDEMCILAKAIQDCFGPHKINYELLGNQVPHLHWHLFPRYRADPGASKPVWLALDRTDADESQRQYFATGTLGRMEIVGRLRRKLTELS